MDSSSNAEKPQLAHQPPSASKDDHARHELSTSASLDRLSISSPARITFGILGATFTGLFLGLSHGSKIASMRFRAENAHRFPTTQKGWYLYHKSKNYHVMLGAIKDGAKMAGKLSFWVGSFFGVEAAIDEARGEHRDFASSTLAGLAVGGGFSVWNRFSGRTAMRTVKMGLYGGLVFGLAQDVAAYAKGGRLRYVDIVLGRGDEDKSGQEVANG